MSGESQSIRVLHVADPRRESGLWRAGCICGWIGPETYMAEAAAVVESRRHARDATLAQIAHERGARG